MDEFLCEVCAHYSIYGHELNVAPLICYYGKMNKVVGTNAVSWACTVPQLSEFVLYGSC